MTIDANGKTTDTLGIHVLSGGHLTLDNVIEEHGVAPLDPDGVARGGGFRVDQGGSLTIERWRHPLQRRKGGRGRGRRDLQQRPVTLNGVGLADNMDLGTPSFGGAIFTDGHGATTVIHSEFFSNTAILRGRLRGKRHARP